MTPDDSTNRAQGDQELFPVAIARNEDRTSEVAPLRGQDCPACGYDRFSSDSWFSSRWNHEPARMSCPDCGATFELVARRVDDAE